MIYGSAFILAGVFIVSFVMFSEEHIAHHGILERLLAGFVGLGFICGGAVFAFGKSGIVIDRSQRIVRRWNGLFFRFTTDTFPLHAFNRVTIEQKGPSNFIVIIEGGDEMVTLFSSGSYSVARERAETIAMFVNLKCHDEVQENNLARKT